MATHGADRQTGRNIALKVRAIEEGRGHSTTKNVSVSTDGAPNMASDVAGAAEHMVVWSEWSCKMFVCVSMCPRKCAFVFTEYVEIFNIEGYRFSAFYS
jgi:hypothetical protein